MDKNLVQALPFLLLSLSSLDTSSNALHYYGQISRFPGTIRNKAMQMRLYGSYANYYLRLKKMDSAFYYTSLVYKAAQTSTLSAKLGALDLMSMYYKTLPNADSALQYVTRYYQLKDSMFGDKVVEQTQAMAYTDMQRVKELANQKTAYQNRLRLYGLGGIAALLLIAALLFWRSKKKEEDARLILQKQKEKLQETLTQLKATQTQLIQSEKMASLGELTAGIAHEIQNPLNFVNNFSEVSNELIDEMKDELTKGNYNDAKDIADDVKQNLEKINHHGKRADAIVKGMLQHSRSSSAIKEPTDINALCDEYLRLSYHGLRAKDKSFNATIKTDFDSSIEKINIIPQDIGRVILNLLTNAFYAVNEKSKQQSEGYEPTVSIQTKKINNKVEIKVSDNGNGIPQKVLDKIFQPFFTTKPTGQGTGLGLSLSYDIVQAHGGELKVETKEGSGSTFIIQLPTNFL
ncbi:MAG: ATP-binding protein [Chitinophagaceae bacterium]